MFFLSFWGKVGEAILDAVRSLMLSLCDIVYKIIVFLYNIFVTLGNAEILGSSKLEEIYRRIGLILGLFMIFRITISLIQYLINPDMMLDKQKGLFNIVKRIIIVVVLLGVTPSLFQFAYSFQKTIIKSNIIPMIITGNNIESDAKDFGVTLAWTAFSTFYSFDDRVSYDDFDECPELKNGYIYSRFESHKTLDYAYNCVNEKIPYKSYDDRDANYYLIDFAGNGIIALIVGIVILWMIIMYTIQAGVRVIQLAYLQLVAPIPIISYLTPKGEETFNKWVKQCTSTYLDFFIRIAIIYFVIFLIDFIIGVGNNDFVSSLGDVSGFSMTWIEIVMILSLLIFAKKVPDLFKELFPFSKNAASFDFGLSPKKVFNDTMAAGLIGGTVGALGAGASNAIHGFRNIGKAWKDSRVSMKKWNDLTDAEREGKNKKDYNAERRAQMWRRTGVVTGAGFKSVFSVAGGVAGGAKAGLKTKDITKSGEAIKTANKNREERELRKEAGYHVWNTAHDKILEFAGESGYTDIVKNRQQAVRDERQRQSDLDDGERLYYTFGVPEPGSNERKLDANRAFKHSEYQKSYKQLKDAKGDAKEAELVLQHENARLNSAYNNPNLHSSDSGVRKIAEDELTLAKERYEIAYGNNKAMQGKLELAKAKHDSNKKIYIDDAKVEDLFKFYADTHAELKPLEASDNPGSNPSVSPTTKIDINAYLNNGFTEGEKPIDISPTDLAKIKEKLVSDLNAQEEVLSNAMRAQRDAMAKTPFSDESKEAQSKTKDEEAKRDLISEQLANVEQLINGINNKVTKLSKKERSKLKAQMRKAESEGNATEQARIEKILIEDDKLSE